MGVSLKNALMNKKKLDLLYFRFPRNISHHNFQLVPSNRCGGWRVTVAWARAARENRPGAEEGELKGIAMGLSQQHQGCLDRRSRGFFAPVPAGPAVAAASFRRLLLRPPRAALP